MIQFIFPCLDKSYIFALLCTTTGYSLCAITILLLILRYVFIVKDASPDRPHAMPGPRWIPMLGNWDIVTKGQILQPFELLQHLAQKHGSVYGVYFGSSHLTVLNSYAAVKETFIKHGSVFAGRNPNSAMDKYFTKGNQGILFSEGNRWKEQRRFAHRLLKDLGVGKTKMEDIVAAETSVWIKEFTKIEGKAFNIGNYFDYGPSNVVAAILFGRRFDYSNKYFIRFKQIVDDLTECIVRMQTYLTSFPWLKYVPFDPLRQKRFEQLCLEGDEFISWQLREHIKNFDRTAPKDFVDHYLLEMENMQKIGKTDHYFSLTQLHVTVSDLLGAGTETITLALRWAVVFLLHHPQIQKRIQKELDEVIGDNRRVSLHDRKNLDYTDAFIHEVLRCGRAVAATVIHETTEPIKVLGYNFPIRSRFLVNLYGVNSDPDYWHEPEEFRPERFLKNEKFVKPEGFICFGAGKRICIGETIAQCEMFLFLATLLQNFTFKLPDGAKLPSLYPIDKGNLHPEEFQVVVEKR